MTFFITGRFSFLLLLVHISSSLAFIQPRVKKEIRPDLHDIVCKQERQRFDIQLHVGDENSGFLTVQDIIVELGSSLKNDEEELVKLPGSDSPYSSGGRHLNFLSKGTYINMKGTQHVDCERGCWEMCWVRGTPAGTIVFAFNLPQTYSRNQAILPGGNVWLSFPVWTKEGLKYGQMAKREILDEIELYHRKWNEELDKYEMTGNPIMKALHERNAHIYATKCDELYDYSLDTIPDDNQCSELQGGLLLSKKGLIWKKDVKNDLLLGHAVASPFRNGHSRSTFPSSRRLRP